MVYECPSKSAIWVGIFPFRGHSLSPVVLPESCVGHDYLGRGENTEVSQRYVELQEIIFSLRPTLVIEFGTRFGGSALFFAAVMRQLGSRFRILSVDIDAATVSEKTRQDSNIELLVSSSVDPKVAQRIAALRREYPGPVFAILDSDHSKAHVLREMKLLRPVLIAGDYIVVEDANVNGHPVYASHGPGPFEAMEEYFQEYPDDYVRDAARESKFGFTFATRGFLIRR